MTIRFAPFVKEFDKICTFCKGIRNFWLGGLVRTLFGIKVMPGWWPFGPCLVSTMVMEIISTFWTYISW